MPITSGRYGTLPHLTRGQRFLGLSLPQWVRLVWSRPQRLAPGDTARQSAPQPQEAPLPTTVQPRQPEEPLVNFGGRVRESLRRRLRMYAAANDLDLQDILDQALTEFLDREGA